MFKQGDEVYVTIVGPFLEEKTESKHVVLEVTPRKVRISKYGVDEPSFDLNDASSCVYHPKTGTEIECAIPGFYSYITKAENA